MTACRGVRPGSVSCQDCSLFIVWLPWERRGDLLWRSTSGITWVLAIFVVSSSVIDGVSCVPFWPTWNGEVMFMKCFSLFRNLYSFFNDTCEVIK